MALAQIDEEIKALLEAILLTKGRPTQEQIQSMFSLYNKVMAKNETGKHCAGCRARVYKGLQSYFEKKQKEDETNNKNTDTISNSSEKGIDLSGTSSNNMENNS